MNADRRIVYSRRTLLSYRRSANALKYTCIESLADCPCHVSQKFSASQWPMACRRLTMSVTSSDHACRPYTRCGSCARTACHAALQAIFRSVAGLLTYLLTYLLAATLLTRHCASLYKLYFSAQNMYYDFRAL